MYRIAESFYVNYTSIKNKNKQKKKNKGSVENKSFLEFSDLLQP